MRESRRWVGLLAAAALATLAACGTTPGAESPAAPGPGPTDPRPPTGGDQQDCGDGTTPQASFPVTPLPEPGVMPAGTHLAEIQRRGRLRAGVSADTNLMGFRDPADATLKGFDIDLVREIAAAVFGDPARVDFVTISRARRVEVLERAEVDVVAHTLRMTCERWQRILFSTEYFRSGQRVLVRSDSRATGITDLGGQRVCALEGSTTLDVLRGVAGVIPVGVEDVGDCLVRFQQGEVEAVSSDDTVLQGLARQDPYARVVGPEFAAQPYGLGLPPAHPEMVGFVNAVLDRVRRTGRWDELYRHWLARDVPGAAMPAPDHSRRRP